MTKISTVVGLEEKKISKHEICTPSYEFGYNDCVSQVAKFEMDSERLANVIWENCPIFIQSVGDQQEHQRRCRLLATSIISKASSWIVRIV